MCERKTKSRRQFRGIISGSRRYEWWIRAEGSRERHVVSLKKAVFSGMSDERAGANSVVAENEWHIFRTSIKIRISIFF